MTDTIKDTQKDGGHKVKAVKHIAAEIESNRRKFGWSLDELARQSGISKTHLWALEKGRSPNITVSIVERLSDAFTISPAEFIGWVDSTNLTVNERKVIQIMRNEARATLKGGE